MDERSGWYYDLHKKEYVTLKECRSALDFISETVEKKKNHIGYPVYECPFKQGKSRWNSCLAPDNFVESGVVKYNKEEQQT